MSVEHLLFEMLTKKETILSIQFQIVARRFIQQKWKETPHLFSTEEVGF